MLGVAMSWALNGVPVFPLRGKVPAIPGGRGLLDATTNRRQITAWWKQYPDANVGLCTGYLFDVVDIDGPQGLDSLSEARGHQEPGLTGPMVRTGKGWHVYVKPTGLGNKAGFLPSVDYRGKGGYVVSPHSTHPDGNRYIWLNPSMRDLTDVPPWLLQVLEPPGPERRPTVLTGQGDAYGRAALRRELEVVRAAAEGKRNHTLNRAAFVLGQLVGAGRLDQEHTMHELVEAGMTSGLSLKECITTVRSGITAGMEQPRNIQAVDL